MSSNLTCVVKGPFSCVLKSLFASAPPKGMCYSTKRGSDRRDFGVYKVVKPGFVSDKLSVPSFIAAPPYILKPLLPEPVPKEPEIKTPAQIKLLRRSCYIARLILDTVAQEVEVGVSTDELDKLVHRLCIEQGVYPSPLGYCGFPKSVCTSVNNVACHGIPDDRALEDGDIINIDVTVFANGYHGDCSAMYFVGMVDRAGYDLVAATEQCLQDALAICRDGEFFSSIGEVITESASDLGYRVVPCFVGHGIGHYFHGPPDIYHCQNDYPGKMRPGMTFTIEPVLTQGDPDTVILEDGWTAVTADNARTAQIEHTVLITESGCEVLTNSTVEKDF